MKDKCGLFKIRSWHRASIQIKQLAPNIHKLVYATVQKAGNKHNKQSNIPTNLPTNQTKYQPAEQSIYLPTKQSTNQPTNIPINQPTNKPNDLPINQRALSGQQLLK